MEILNNAQVTPKRLHALLCLVQQLRQSKREDLLDLLQPPEISENQTAAKAVYTAASNLSLIQETEDKIVKIHANVWKGIEDISIFRQYLQTQFAGIANDQMDNYLLNLFTAWYAVQNERIFEETNKVLTNRFNRELFPAEEATESDDYGGRAFNTTKYNGWRTWATFLGWGWRAPENYIKTDVVPDATIRLQPLLPKLLPEKEFISFRTFIGRLSDVCPELDNGRLFEMCWDASRGTEKRSNQLSLMLSTALRTLHETEELELKRQADSSDLWHLFEAEGALFRQITHIRIGK